MFLFDIGIGLLLSTAMAIYAGLEPSLWLLATGICGSILPDWDMIPHLIKKGGKLDQWAHKHRDISHYPLLIIPLATVAVGYLAGFWYGVIIATTTTAHYLADSEEIGWGVRWLYPFSRRYFAYRSVDEESKRFHAWTPKEQNKIAAKYGNPQWSKDKSRWLYDYLVFLTGIATASWWYYFH